MKGPFFILSEMMLSTAASPTPFQTSNPKRISPFWFTANPFSDSFYQASVHFYTHAFAFFHEESDLIDAARIVKYGGHVFPAG